MKAKLRKLFADIYNAQEEIFAAAFWFVVMMVFLFWIPILGFILRMIYGD